MSSAHDRDGVNEWSSAADVGYHCRRGPPSHSSFAENPVAAREMAERRAGPFGVRTSHVGARNAQLTGVEWRSRTVMPMFRRMDASWLPENRWMRQSLLAAIVLYGWTVFGILSSAHFFLGEEAASGSALLADIAGHVLLFYWAWAAVTPLVWLVLRRAVNQGTSTHHRWAIIVLATPALIALHGVLYLAAVHLAGLADETQAATSELANYVMRHAGGDLATVAVLVGVYLLFDARQRAQERKLESAALEARVAAADLELLRSQLQPHFLFNALNTVSTLVLRGDNESADVAIGRISRYLRSALEQRADVLVSVREELADVAQYFAIERLRFGDALCHDVRVDEDARNARIPALVVQPLVENAIRHGASPAGGATRIGILASIEDGRLRLRVRDPGSPRAAEQRGDTRDEGFGLRYVRGRVRHFYGVDASVTLEHSPTGTIATIDVPLAPCQRREVR
jgi:two-component system LytT family sensor kinase